MGFLINTNKLDVLKKTQENLEQTQKNNEMLREVLQQLIENKKDTNGTDVMNKTQENLEQLQKNNELLKDILKQVVDNKEDSYYDHMINTSKENIELLKASFEHFAIDQAKNNTEFLVKQKEYEKVNTELLTETLNKLTIVQKDMINELVEQKKELSQNHNELLTLLLTQIIESTNTTESQTLITEEEKLKAAYALNLCTVSVSQIIDYNDVNFLEREYEAILNNLNLENMPKDEALLSILKQLLDVITFFRIQEGEKKILENEYQAKVKSAVWAAVPNIGLIVAGGNPLTMLVSLASQVGIGYMNYRKEKAKINLEEERSKWELEKSAIEQFNGLRRELFDTAWRLADSYGFKDEYRITERQITQYNNILLDVDPIRRYERLYYIKDNFRAYPPFLYYLGNAANDVFNSSSYDVEIQIKYRKLAMSAYEDFLSLTEQNLLREDQVESACCLELFDLLDLNEQKTRTDLLDRACKSSGYALDVVQMVCLSYLKIGHTDKAIEYLRVLVNENYNPDVNEKLLSRLYVSKYICGDNDSKIGYMEIKNRCNPYNLFPIPESLPKNNADIKLLEMDYINKQKKQLEKQLQKALSDFITKYDIRYDRLIYSQGNITNEMEQLFSEMVEGIKPLELSWVFEDVLKDTLNKNTAYNFSRMLECEYGGLNRTPKVKFEDIVGNALNQIVKRCNYRLVSSKDLNSITGFETCINNFILHNNLPSSSNNNTQLKDEKKISFDFSTRGKENKILENKCLEVINRYKDEFEYNGLCCVTKDDLNFIPLINVKFNNKTIYDNEKPDKEEVILGYIYSGSEKEHKEMLLTTKKIHYYYVKDTIFGDKYVESSFYSNVTYTDGEIYFFGNSLMNLNMNYAVKSEIFKLCKDLASCVSGKSDSHWITNLVSKIKVVK